MAENITPRHWYELPNKLTWDVGDALDTALARLSTQLYGAARDATTAREQGPAQERDFHLARIAASAILADYLRALAHQDATNAGQASGAPATYTALGKAAGITKEGARGRWPFAVTDPKPGRPKDTRHRWERYLDDAERSLQDAGVHTSLAWAQTEGTGDERGQRWEGAVQCGADVLAWNEDEGWFLVRGQDVLPITGWVDAPVDEVVRAALAYLPVLAEVRPGQVQVGDRVRDGDYLWQVTDAPLIRPDGTVAVPVRDTAEAEERTHLDLGPDQTLKVERGAV